MPTESTRTTIRKTLTETQTMYDWDLFMMRLYYREGVKKKSTIKLFGNKPILLNKPDTFWVLYSGEVDVFAVDHHEGQITSSRTHLFHVEAGEAVFGMPNHPSKLLIASSTSGIELVALPRSTLVSLIQDSAFVTPAIILIEMWLRKLSASVFTRLAPKEFTALEPLQEFDLPAGSVVRNRKGLVWVEALSGNVKLNGQSDLTLQPGDLPLPLTSQSWLEASESSRVSSSPTGQLFTNETLWPALDHFHELVLNYTAKQSAAVGQKERQRLQRRSVTDSEVVESAFQQLATILEPEKAALAGVDTVDPLLAACRLVGNAMGIEVKESPVNKHSYVYPMQHIATASRFRARQVVLKGRWWEQDNGPLLGSITEDKGTHKETHYVALLPTSATSYKLHDPVQGKVYTVTPDIAETLDSFAFVFYRPLPARVLNGFDLIRFSIRSYTSDLLTVAGVGAIVGLVGIILPLITGQIFDTILPAAERTTLIGVGMILIVSAISTALFEITRNIALLRMEGKMGLALQAATMDRVLDLPPTFFRQFTTGDLGMRVMSIDAIRQAISGTVVQSVLASVFSVFSFGILFAFDARLGLVATGLLILLFVVIVSSSVIQLRFERKLRAVQGTLSSTVLQFIQGIPKFRVAGAEKRAFAYWARQFSIQRKLRFQSKNTANMLSTFNDIFPVITLIAIFSVVIFSDSRQLSTGQFLAFNAAFTQVSVAVLQLSAVFSTIIGIMPIFERTKPILETVPETGVIKADPGELHGEVEINNVSFRYTPGGPMTLNNVSIEARPGQFIALVGPSGSGKSTIMRLLLGFETPESGTVLYDGQDLSELDIRAVRSQIGVVLQNGKLMVGDIYRNIVGASTLTVKDAWDAAKMVGLDEDITRMPMGMNTLVSEGGGTLSGGQRQRLMIARAIVNKPRLIFFDEATSALDNRTQSIVSNSLDNLEATRIVIAHRLTTIVHADYVYVMDQGQVVQRGTYDELIKQKGLFADLARRQLV